MSSGMSADLELRAVPAPSLGDGFSGEMSAQGRMAQKS